MEKLVVEGHDVFLRPVVGAERSDVQLHLWSRKLVFYAVEQPPVAGAPPVDALLDVAHYQVAAILMAHALLQQHLEVFPLYGAGVLKLVYHDVAELCAYLLEDKGRVAVLYQGVQQRLCVAQQESVGLGVQDSHFFLDTAEQAQLVHVPQREVGLVQPHLLHTLSLGLVEVLEQYVVHQVIDWVSWHLFFFLHPFPGVVHSGFDRGGEHVLVIVFAVA